MQLVMGGAYYKCSACGATFTDIPKPLRVADLDTWVDEKGFRHYHPAGVHDKHNDNCSPREE